MTRSPTAGSRRQSSSLFCPCPASSRVHLPQFPLPPGRSRLPRYRVGASRGSDCISYPDHDYDCDCGNDGADHRDGAAGVYSHDVGHRMVRRVSVHVRNHLRGHGSSWGSRRTHVDRGDVCSGCTGDPRPAATTDTVCPHTESRCRDHTLLTAFHSLRHLQVDTCHTRHTARNCRHSGTLGNAIFENCSLHLRESALMEDSGSLRARMGSEIFSAFPREHVHRSAPRHRADRLPLS